MNSELLIAQGNTFREQRNPTEALKCYGTALLEDPDNPAAWNNYGNVMREMGRPDRAIPFLQHALALYPGYSTAEFNLAVSYLLMGDYQRGWPAYESRWNYEHLAGRLPVNEYPRWQGEDLKGKVIHVISEQGIGDNIQFSRFLYNLHAMGATVVWVVDPGMKELFPTGDVINYTVNPGEEVPVPDYWTVVMSIPGQLGITVDNLPKLRGYLHAQEQFVTPWRDRLGAKKKMRVGFCWSGRRDTWINNHKALPFELMFEMIKSRPEYQWVSLQIDASPEETQLLESVGVESWPGSVRHLGDTAGLISLMDVVIGVDTAVSHLSGALGVPTWLMLNWYAQDWRYLLGRNDCIWYPSMRLFRQPGMDQWQPVTQEVLRWLDLNKI